MGDTSTLQWLGTTALIHQVSRSTGSDMIDLKPLLNGKKNEPPVSLPPCLKKMHFLVSVKPEGRREKKPASPRYHGNYRCRSYNCLPCLFFPPSSVGAAYIQCQWINYRKAYGWHNLQRQSLVWPIATRRAYVHVVMRTSVGTIGYVHVCVCVCITHTWARRLTTKRMKNKKKARWHHRTRCHTSIKLLLSDKCKRKVHWRD